MHPTDDTMSAPESGIHPTAVVHPSARIGAEVAIGPYCVIHEDVEIGNGCWFQNHVTVCGPTKIGRDNRFHAFGSIGQRSQDLKYAGEPTHLEIGDGNVFREFVTVNRATSPGGFTRIGNQGNFLAYAHIAHDCTVGDHVIFSNNGTLAGHVARSNSIFKEFSSDVNSVVVFHGDHINNFLDLGVINIKR